jgi:hypothetical protein
LSHWSGRFHRRTPERTFSLTSPARRGSVSGNSLPRRRVPAVMGEQQTRAPNPLPLVAGQSCSYTPTSQGASKVDGLSFSASVRRIRILDAFN